MDVEKLQPGEYIIAVSGGVDSMALLDYLLRHQPEVGLIVAHFDHGIRKESIEDTEFVRELAKKYQLPFQTQRGELGAEASEEIARKARYDFLREIKQKYNAKGIITAHHANDVVETMIINIMRGTGWRGLCSLRSTKELFRPLLGVPKADIVSYVKEHDVSWREDRTNTDSKYLRNKIRQEIMPFVDVEKWLSLYTQQLQLQQRIDEEIDGLPSRKRYDFIMWPRSVAVEILRKELKITRPQAQNILVGLKTGRIGTTLEVSKGQKIILNRDSFIVQESPS